MLLFFTFNVQVSCKYKLQFKKLSESEVIKLNSQNYVQKLLNSFEVLNEIP
jgi:hypothetical protein